MSKHTSTGSALVASPVPNLTRSITEPRALRSALLTIGAWIVALIASIPLFSVLYAVPLLRVAGLAWNDRLEAMRRGRRKREWGEKGRVQRAKWVQSD